MPQFQLDTSGAVPPLNPIESEAFVQSDYLWRDLDAFTQGYIEALFFTSDEELRSRVGAIEDGRADDPYGFSDLAPETLERIMTDCAAFQRDNAATLEEAYRRDYDAAQAGRDYWFTRNGHGVGFWDRDALEPDSAEYERITSAMVDARRSNGDWDALLSQRNRLKAESIGERLSAACRHQSVDAYLGDDDRVYIA